MAEEKKLKVILIRHTLSPEETVSLGAKLCYSKSTIEDLQQKVSRKDYFLIKKSVAFKAKLF